MLLPFFYTLRHFKIPVGTQEWLYLMEALSQDLHQCSLERFYYLGRSLLVKSEALFDAYDQAFLACFRNMEGNFPIRDEILDWLNRQLEGKSRPALPPGITPLDLEELRKKFLERLQQQKEAHHGGNFWIGTGGTSPFGHSGSHPSGIRLGGPGGGRSAVKVAEERRFQNYRQDQILDTRQFKVALKRLRRLESEGAPQELNIKKTIQRTCQNAGEIELVFEATQKNQVELLLLMDSGGSMDPYSHLVEALFSAAHASTHFKAFRHYYFHNCVYTKLYTDMAQRHWIHTDEIYRKYRGSFHVVIMGDACMNPYELFAPNGSIDYWEEHSAPGFEYLRKLREHFPSIVWLNPEPRDSWNYHPTIKAISELIKMYPLTVEGLTEAVNDLRKGIVLPKIGDPQTIG